MKQVWIVYRESDAVNIAAFVSYEAAVRYILMLPENDEREDYFIEPLNYYEI